MKNPPPLLYPPKPGKSRAFPIQPMPVPFPRHSRASGNPARTLRRGAPQAEHPSRGRCHAEGVTKGVRRFSLPNPSGLPNPPSLPTQPPGSFRLAASPRATSLKSDVLNGARVSRPQNERSGQDARDPILNWQPFGPEARNWIPAFAGMTGEGNGHRLDRTSTNSRHSRASGNPARTSRRGAPQAKPPYRGRCHAFGVTEGVGRFSPPKPSAPFYFHNSG
jgi:hypothetical protein